MTATRTDHDQTYDAAGNLVDEQIRIVDITEETNETTMRAAAVQALEANRTFLAITGPTQAQVLAQVRALTHQNVRLIRLALGMFDATD